MASLAIVPTMSKSTVSTVRGDLEAHIALTSLRTSQYDPSPRAGGIRRDGRVVEGAPLLRV